MCSRKKPKKKPKAKKPPLKVIYMPMSSWSILPKAETPLPNLPLE